MRSPRPPDGDAIRAVALASGSNGNAVLVETADARLLFDCGISGRRLAQRAASRGVDLLPLDAVLLSHAHGDHVGGAGVVGRRLHAPVAATRATWARARARIGSVDDARTFASRTTLRFGDTLVHTLPTPHDVQGSVAFVVESQGRRFGILTDLGHAFGALQDLMPTLDGAILEANHDPAMLEASAYPLWLQERIAGSGGHLSNGDCADLASRCAGSRLRVLVLAHLSGEANTPRTAREQVTPHLASHVEVHVAPRDAASDVVSI